MDGVITFIQRNSMHDGPGIRSTVFLKGCTLRCFWCHNPETINPALELQFFAPKCIGCGLCVSACPTGARYVEDGKIAFNRKLCQVCGKCAETCAPKALVLSGRKVNTEEVLSEIIKDRPFYEASGGGVTFSGGEPLYQKDFLKSLLIGCKGLGLHTAVDTAGNVPWEHFAEILPYTDLFLYDLKTIDPQIHRQAAGADNKRLLENLDRLSSSGVKIWIRVPIVPGINDTKLAMEEISAFLEGKKGIERVELLPFHKLAQHKYESLGLDYQSSDLNSPSAELIHSLNEVFTALPYHREFK